MHKEKTNKTRRDDVETSTLLFLLSSLFDRDVKLAASVQWIHLRLPSSGPWFESHALNLWFYKTKCKQYNIIS